MRPELGRVAALCATAHPLHTEIAERLGASMPEATTRPDPRRALGEPRARSPARADADAAEPAAGLDEGILQLSPSNLLYIENPYRRNKIQ